MQSLLHENLFHVKYRMSHIAFDKLLELLRPALTLKEKYAVLSGLEPISCEIMLHCALRYLSGGSYHDIRATCYISKPSFFRLLWHTIDAINACDALELWLPSTREELDAKRRFLEKCDNFNFFLSQLRIRIEMAFGLLVTKWRILHIPINVKFSNLRKLVSAIVRLHNYCIDEREPTVAIQRMYKVAKNSHHAHEPTELGYIPSDAPSVISREGSSHLREILVRRVANNNLVRPVTVGTKVGLAQRRQAMYE